MHAVINAAAEWEVGIEKEKAAGGQALCISGIDNEPMGAIMMGCIVARVEKREAWGV